jgi:hypothetical protein
MSRIRSSALLAFAATFLVVASAEALSINYAALPDQGSLSGIVQSTGGVTVSAQGFGGVNNPQNTMTPTGTPGGFTALGLNIGGVDPLLGTRGLGCGILLASQCDLIAPIGEDVLRLSFSQAVQLDQIVFAAMEDADEVNWYRWNGSAYTLVGSDSCDLFSFCGGNETYNGPYGPASQSWIFIADNAGATAFALKSISFTVVPEPGTALLLVLGLGAVAARRGR